MKKDIAKTKVCPYPRIREKLSGARFCVPDECFYWKVGYGKLRADAEYDLVGRCICPDDIKTIKVDTGSTGYVSDEIW